MVRENQGLQIALIVFVMITILLGVTTYMFFRKYDDASAREAKNLADKTQADKTASDNVAEVARLKAAIGLAAAEKSDETAKDIQKYGKGFPEDSQAYRKLLEKMQQVIDKKGEDLAAAKAQIQTLEESFRVRVATSEPKIKTAEQEREKAIKDLVDEQAKFKDDRDRNNEEKDKLSKELAGERKKSDTSAAKVEQTKADAIKALKQRETVISTLSTERAKLVTESFEDAEGDIRWVNQRTGTVWISLGRADQLQRQITFSVFPPNAKEMPGSGKKASIEVTQVLDEHLAEARLYDDKIADPVVPGDKIFTPVWAPGEKRHFALAGFMDLDGDGKNDQARVKEIITLNGGVVDAYVDEKGKLVGAVTVNTRCIVKGEPPNEKGESTMAAWNKILIDGERYHVQQVDAIDLLLRMGWKNAAKIVKYGAGANVKDFAAKAAEGAQKKAPGNVSGVFDQRPPERRPPKTAY